jgi:hypothetical protein
LAFLGDLEGKEVAGSAIGYEVGVLVLLMGKEVGGSAMGYEVGVLVLLVGKEVVGESVVGSKVAPRRDGRCVAAGAFLSLFLASTRTTVERRSTSTRSGF